jgi:hypothetical protein
VAGRKLVVRLAVTRQLRRGKSGFDRVGRGGAEGSGRSDVRGMRSNLRGGGH